MNRAEKTKDLFTKGTLNCAQAIMTVYGEEFGIDADAAREYGRPLGGGFGVTGEICGFLSGAALVLSHACRHPDEGQAKQKTREKVVALLEAFRESHGGVTCNQLLGVERNTVEGEEKIKSEKLVPAHCPGFGMDTARILEKLLVG